MNPSDNDTSLTEAGIQAGYVPALRPDATLEELDEWVRSLGGRELTAEQAAKVRAGVRWHSIPGETP